MEAKYNLLIARQMLLLLYTTLTAIVKTEAMGSPVFLQKGTLHQQNFLVVWFFLIFVIFEIFEKCPKWNHLARFSWQHENIHFNQSRLTLYTMFYESIQSYTKYKILPLETAHVNFCVANWKALSSFILVIFKICRQPQRITVEKPKPPKCYWCRDILLK